MEMTLAMIVLGIILGVVGSIAITRLFRKLFCRKYEICR
jgi:hypothetical protein